MKSTLWEITASAAYDRIEINKASCRPEMSWGLVSFEKILNHDFLFTSLPDNVTAHSHPDSTKLHHSLHFFIHSSALFSCWIRKFRIKQTPQQSILNWCEKWWVRHSQYRRINKISKPSRSITSQVSFLPNVKMFSRPTPNFSINKKLINWLIIN